MNSLRAGLHRHFTGPLVGRKFNIIKDPVFTQANEQLEARSKQYSKSNEAKPVKHKDPLSDEDLAKVGKYIATKAKTTPFHLQRSVWFLHNLTGGFRGVEVYKELMVKDVKITIDDSGKEYVTVSEERSIKTKTYQGGISKKSRDTLQTPRIYEIPNKNVCFVELMKFFLSKLRKYK